MCYAYILRFKVTRTIAYGSLHFTGEVRRTPPSLHSGLISSILPLSPENPPLKLFISIEYLLKAFHLYFPYVELELGVVLKKGWWKLINWSTVYEWTNGTVSFSGHLMTGVPDILIINLCFQLFSKTLREIYTLNRWNADVISRSSWNKHPVERKKQEKSFF